MNEQVNYAKIQRIQDDLEALTIGMFGTGFVTDAMLYESGIKATVAQHTSDLVENTKQVGNRLTTAYDTFNRADGQVLVSDNGQNYLVAGDNGACLFQVKNNKAVLGDLGNAYISLDAGDNIETLGAEWVWQSGTTDSTLALVITGDTDLSLGNLLHFITNNKNWNLQVRKGGSGQPLNTVLSGTYKTPLNQDGASRYRFEMTVNREKNIAYLRLPDGDIVSYTSTDIPTVSKTRGYWQIIRRNATDSEPQICSIWLTKKDTTLKYHSGKENLDVMQGIVRAKEYVSDNSLNKKLYSFTPSASGWYRVLSGVLDTLVGMARIYTDGQYDGTITDLEVDFGSSAFNGSSPTIQQFKHSSFNDGIVSKIRIGNNGSNTHYLDVYIKSATNPAPIYFEFSGYSLVKALNSTGQTLYNPTSNPADPTNSATLTVGMGFRTTSIIHSVVQEVEFENVTATGNVNMKQSISSIDATSGNITLTLPNSTQNANHVHTFSRIDGSANTVSIIGYFSDGTTTKALSRGVPFKVVGNPSSNQWLII